FLTRSSQLGLGLASLQACGWLTDRTRAGESSDDIVSNINISELRAVVEAAIQKNILPAAVETAYPGHFQITADGSSYSGDATWPGLDSWQMAGAYLLLGRSRLAMDYFDFVRVSQRKDGN